MTGQSSILKLSRFDVIVCLCFERFRCFPDNHFPGQTFPGQDISQTSRFPDKTFPGQDVSRTRPFPDNHFPGQTFPGQVILRNFHVDSVCKYQL